MASSGSRNGSFSLALARTAACPTAYRSRSSLLPNSPEMNVRVAAAAGAR